MCVCVYVYGSPLYLPISIFISVSVSLSPLLFLPVLKNKQEFLLYSSLEPQTCASALRPKRLSLQTLESSSQRTLCSLLTAPPFALWTGTFEVPPALSWVPALFPLILSLFFILSRGLVAQSYHFSIIYLEILSFLF